MYTEKRKVYSVPFITLLMNRYSNEKNDFFNSYNNSLCSIMAIGFMETNPKYIKRDQHNIWDFVVDFDRFISSFNVYEDIESFFNKSTDELNGMFKGSPHYIKMDIPEEVKWTIQSDKALVNTALVEIKKTFAFLHTSDRMMNDKGKRIAPEEFMSKEELELLLHGDDNLSDEELLE